MKQIAIYDVVYDACVQRVRTNINTPSEFVGSRIWILEFCGGGKTIKEVESKSDNNNQARAT